MVDSLIKLLIALIAYLWLSPHFRVKLYIKNGWDSRYLINPDDGGSVPDYNRIYSANESFVASLLDNPVPAGYTSELANVPQLDDGHIFQYFLVKCDNMKSTAQKHRDKGWNFYRSDKVLCSEFKCDVDDTVMIVRADVAASFDRGVVTGKTKKVYPIHILLDKFTGTILGARCKCKAGYGGYCKHVAAVLFQIMDSQRKGLIFTPTVSAKTSTLQTWHQPKVKGQCLVKFADLNFETFSYERDNDPSAAKRAKTDYSALKEKCPDGDNCVTVERLEKFSQELSSLGVASQFVEILSANKFQPTHTQRDESVVVSSSKFAGQVPFYEANFTLTDEQKEFYDSCVKISSISQQQLISECTKGQANNIKWFEERKIRLTASHFKEIVRRKAYPCDKLLKRLCLKTKPFTSKHTEWGKQAEPLALAQYKLKLESDGYKVTGRDLGLIVSPRYPYLGASPDWFVSLQKDGVVEHGLVEVKSLSKHAIFTPLQAASMPNSFYSIENGQVILDIGHAYYYQVQGQLAVCEMDWCDMVIWTPSGMECQRIYRDLSFWEEILPPLSEFYFHHMLPYIVSETKSDAK